MGIRVRPRLPVQANRGIGMGGRNGGSEWGRWQKGGAHVFELRFSWAELCLRIERMLRWELLYL